MLAESIAQRGLINPITITDSNRLVAGLHRLKACESLGWEKIPANILQLDEIEAEITEIDENRFRHELSALQRADLLLRRKELYEARYPQTRHGRSKERIEAEVKRRTCTLLPSFSENTANQTNLSRRTIQVEVAIAKNLSPEVKEMIRKTPLEDRKTDLLTLSKLPQEEQYIVAQMAVTQPEAKLSEILKSRAVESADSQVCDFASKPIFFSSSFAFFFLTTSRTYLRII